MFSPAATASFRVSPLFSLDWGRATSFGQRMIMWALLSLHQLVEGRLPEGDTVYLGHQGLAQAHF
jgi:hypothetical protein